jgi:hypothetical protein
MEALLSRPNYGDIMPRNAHLMAPDQLLHHLENKRFQMGWFVNNSTSEKYSQLVQWRTKAIRIPRSRRETNK